MRWQQHHCYIIGSAGKRAAFPEPAPSFWMESFCSNRKDFVGRTPRSPAERLHTKLLHEFSSVLSKQPINIGAKRASSKLEKIRATFSRPVDDAENRIVNLKLLCADVVGIFILLWEACSTFHVRVSARHAAEVGIGSTLSTSLKPGESKTSEFPPKPRLFSRTYVFIALVSTYL